MELKNPATGIKHYCEIKGEGNPPVVLLHGWTGNVTRWGRVPSLICSKNKVISYDLRGHSLSDKGNELDYSLDAHVRDLEGVLDALGIDRAVIGGHSMGGMISLMFALKRPERVKKLILAATAAGLANDEQVVNRLMFGVRMFSFMFNFTLWMKNSKKRKAPDLYPDAFDKKMKPAKAATVQSLLEMSNLDLRGRLKEINIPALVIATETDETIPVHLTKELAELLPDSRLLMVENASHQIPVERPDEVADAIRKFLDEK
jgi:pimeloyl-ACP methyl ester carboxylesterase